VKIFLFIDSLTGAGAQRQFTNLAGGLADRGHTITVLVYFDIPFFDEKLTTKNIEIIKIDKKYRFDLYPVFKLHKLLNKHKPDLIVSYLRTPSFYTELTKVFNPKIPIIVSERGGVDLTGLSILDYVSAVGHTISSAVTANSHNYIENMTRYAPWLKSKSHVIYNGVDAIFFKNGEQRLEFIENQLQTNQANSDRKVKFCVVAARVTRQKGSLPLAKAVKLLVSRNITNFSIDWIGPADQNSLLVKEVNQFLGKNDIQDFWSWKGPSKNTAEIYSHYDAFILPSVYEGVANTMCEAMSSALPIIATDIADNSRILGARNRQLMCKPDDPEDLASKIQAFLSLEENETMAHSQESHTTAKNLFEMERYINSWEQLCLAHMKNN